MPLFPLSHAGNTVSNLFREISIYIHTAVDAKWANTVHSVANELLCHIRRQHYSLFTKSRLVFLIINFGISCNYTRSTSPSLSLNYSIFAILSGARPTVPVANSTVAPEASNSIILSSIPIREKHSRTLSVDIIVSRTYLNSLIQWIF